MCKVNSENNCPKCDCEKWKNIVGDTFSKNTNPFSSSEVSVPMYFGRRIDYCPWCGQYLISGDESDDFEIGKTLQEMCKM